MYASDGWATHKEDGDTSTTNMHVEQGQQHADLLGGERADVME